MQNPFKIMIRWLKFEILDIEAILEAISKKNEMEKQQLEKIQQREEERRVLANIMDGKETFSTFFMSKKEKVSKITALTASIQAAGQDIECLGLLHKIVVLQLNQAAIQFFKRDKFTTYNHTVNLYIQKQMENTGIKVALFKKIADNNQSYSTVVMHSEAAQDEPRDSY